MYGAPQKLTDEQELWLALNLTTARMVQVENAVLAADVLSGNPPAEWCEYVGMSEQDRLAAKLLRMMDAQ